MTNTTDHDLDDHHDDDHHDDLPSGGMVLKGALTATPGRFNYNLTLGLPGRERRLQHELPRHARVHVRRAAERARRRVSSSG